MKSKPTNWLFAGWSMVSDGKWIEVYNQYNQLQFICLKQYVGSFLYISIADRF